MHGHVNVKKSRELNWELDSAGTGYGPTVAFDVMVSNITPL
jgi:hypothetical protein